MTSTDEHPTSQAEYYRILYRGIVALFANETSETEKSGAYVNYGDIIKSHYVKVVNRRKRIRVDEVLSGGYAIDQSLVKDSSSLGVDCSDSLNASTVSAAGPLHNFVGQVGGAAGYLYTERRGHVIAERVDSPSFCEAGEYLYKITLSAPVSILVGPALDAPIMNRSVLLPGTVLSVCLKLKPAGSEIMFLRLSPPKKGWIMDRRLVKGVSSNRQRYVTVCAPIITTSDGKDTSSVSITSVPNALKNNVIFQRKVLETPRKLRLQGRGLVGKDEITTVLGYNSDRNNNNNTSDSTTIESVCSPTVSQLSDDSASTIPHRPAQAADSSSFASSSQRQQHKHSNHSSSSATSTTTTPDYFLMRVIAPMGLKILDAPHFQVNNLIHGGGANNSSYTRLMDYGSDQHSHHTATSGNKMEARRSRVFPYGTLFEASKRMESAGLYTHGSGLIKLADNSGWAIVPDQTELEKQCRALGPGNIGIQAVEEVGNAIAGSERRVWLRIITTNGVLVSCYQPDKAVRNINNLSSPVSSIGGSSVTSSTAHAGFNHRINNNLDSDGNSSVTSGLRMSFRNNNTRRQPRKDLISRPPIIPCGTCVEVDLSIQQQHPLGPSGSVQSFARLSNGQGWIPRHLDGEDFSIPIEAPEIRAGSFWFRVEPKRGIAVRQGPSRKAFAIRSERGEEFRFECGEFLRASEVVSVGGESFAKLYRNSDVKQQLQDQLLHHHDAQSTPRHTNGYSLSRKQFKDISMLTAPGEWVPVKIGNRVYIQEHSDPPSIQRRKDGWRYNIVFEAGVQVRCGPSFNAARTGKVLRAGESVLVNERVAAGGDPVTWLRLRDGKGWVHNLDERTHELIMIPHNSSKSRNNNDGSDCGSDGSRSHRNAATLITRLFTNDTTSSVISL